jgi:hypothetical protein
LEPFSDRKFQLTLENGGIGSKYAIRIVPPENFKSNIKRTGSGKGGGGAPEGAMSKSPAKSKMQEEAEDVLLLADLIGIGHGEAEYLWIAKEAFNADLPPGWQIFFDEEGRSFFFEVNKQISSYEHPSLDYYRKLYADFKRKDAEFGEQQRQQEIAFGLREEATGGTSKADTRADTAGGLQRMDSDAGSADPDADRIREEQNKTRLLQAYSNDPNLASKYRADIQVS